MTNLGFFSVDYHSATESYNSALVQTSATGERKELLTGEDGAKIFFPAAISKDTDDRSLVSSSKEDSGSGDELVDSRLAITLRVSLSFWRWARMAFISASCWPSNETAAPFRDAARKRSVSN